MNRFHSDLNEWLTFLTQVGTLLVALYALTSWKRELRFKTDIGLRRTLLTEVYKYVELFHDIRSPFIDRRESVGGIEDPESVAFGRRMEQLQTVASKIKSIKYEVRVIYGAAAEAAVDNLLSTYRDIWAAYATYFDIPKSERWNDQYKDFRKVIYRGLDKEYEAGLKQSIDLMVTEIERQLINDGSRPD